MSKNLYADIFSAPEEDVRTFAEVMKLHNKEKPKGISVSQSGFDEVMRGKVERVSVPVFTKQESNTLSFEHGWSGEDYVWHMQPRSGRGWKVTDERVIFAVMKTVDTVIPRTMHVNIYPPNLDWDIKAYTVKVLDLRVAWNVPEADLKRLTEKLFDVLSTLV